MSEPKRRLTVAARKAVEAADSARRFPTNTCGASRYTQMIGETLAQGQRFAAIEEEPDDVGLALLSTVTSLWEARTRIAELEAKIATNQEPDHD